MYLLFLGPFEDGGDFSDRGIRGITRFISRLYSIIEQAKNLPTVASSGITNLAFMHRTIKKVSEDVENLKFNTAIAALMEYTNWIDDNLDRMTSPQRDEVLKTLVLLLAPLAPFTVEELWERLGGAYSVHQQPWPQFDESLLLAQEYVLPIQVNGKLRHTLTVPVDLTEDEVKALVINQERIRNFIEGKTITKVIYIQKRLINIVVN
jgi:leucyl-tRNA synthetase